MNQRAGVKDIFPYRVVIDRLFDTVSGEEELPHQTQTSETLVRPWARASGTAGADARASDRRSRDVTSLVAPTREARVWPDKCRLKLG
jgi:hypothetical protein